MKRRIIQTTQYSSFFGFDSGKSGVGYENGQWISHSDHSFGNDYVMVLQQRSAFRVNRMDQLYASSSNQDRFSQLAINHAYTSSFGCAEVILINEELELSEMECIEQYLSEKYQFQYKIEGKDLLISCRYEG